MEADCLKQAPSVYCAVILKLESTQTSLATDARFR